MCRIAKVFIVPDSCPSAGALESVGNVAVEKETVWNPVDVSGGVGMWTARVQTLVLLERFSMVVVLRRANWRELPVMPRANRPKRAPLEAYQIPSHMREC